MNERRDSIMVGMISYGIVLYNIIIHGREEGKEVDRHHRNKNSRRDVIDSISILRKADI